jgi:competence protein ComEC
MLLTSLRSIIIAPFVFAADALDAQYGRLFLWMPITLGIGIGLFFMEKNEPSVAFLWCGALFIVIGWCVCTRLTPRTLPFLVALMMISSGYLLAGMRAHMVASPVLTYRYYGPIEGRVIKIDRSASDAQRLTLDRVILNNMSPERTPSRVRISLHSAQITGIAPYTPAPGHHIMLTGHISPPPGPSEPGGFDFQRMAWFDKLGGVGYSRTPILQAGPSFEGVLLSIHTLRQTLSHALQSRMPGQVGAFAAAILTGDRSAISQDTAEHLRSANLSHLLAISGLHMGLLTSVIYGGIRVILACIPFTFYHFPNKKIAASCALFAGGFYLMLSGWNVATERAYIMVSIMFIAILMNRTAISFRSVALAALLILLLRPEVLVEPGFQMSFAATTSLVYVFTVLRQSELMLNWPRWVSNISTVIISSAVAGIATAPIAAAHFNRIADFGLIANVISVPAMGAIVMPSAVLAAALAPFGLEGLALSVMEPAIRWILYVAQTVAGWDGAVTRIPAPSALCTPLIALGGLFVFLWRGKSQFYGCIPVVLGFVLWAAADRPNLLVSADGGLTGRLTGEGRALSKKSGAGFAAQTWLENDGDLPIQALAAARHMPPLDVGGVKIAHVTGRGWRDRLPEACRTHDIVIVNQIWDGAPLWGCELLDLSYLRRSGALAFTPLEAHPLRGARVMTAYGAAGVRLWNSSELRRETSPSKQAAPQAIRQQAHKDVFGMEIKQK